MNESNGLNRSMTSFLDIMTILLLCFSLITVLLAANMSKEYMARVNLLEREKQAETNDIGPGESDAFLTVTAEGKFILEGRIVGEARHFRNQEDLMESLKFLSPSKLYLRVDASIPTGVTQGLLLDSRDLGILPYLAAQDE